MSDYDDFKNESKHNEMMLAIEGYVLDEVEKAVAAERARCAEIVKRHLAPMTHDRAAILYDIEDGGSDEQAHGDQ